MNEALDDLYQEAVVEHKRAPRHFGKLAAPTHEARGRNPQCGDDVQVQLRMEDGRVQDIAFNGQGCAICIARIRRRSGKTWPITPTSGRWAWPTRPRAARSPRRLR